MAGYRNDGGSAIVGAIDSYYRAGVAADERKYAREQDILDRRERRRTRDFNEGIAMRTAARADGAERRAQGAYDSSLADAAAEKKAKQGVVDSMFAPDAEEIDTGVPAADIQKYRKPDSANQFSGNTVFRRGKDGNMVAGAYVEDKASATGQSFVPYNANPVDDNSPVMKVKSADVEKIISHTQNVVEKAAAIDPNIDPAMVANASISSDADGNTRPSTEEEFSQKIAGGSAAPAELQAEPQFDVPDSDPNSHIRGDVAPALGIDNKIFNERTQYAMTGGSSASYGPMDAIDSITKVISADKKPPGIRGAVPQAYQDVANGIMGLPDDALALYNTANDVVKGAARFTANDVVKGAVRFTAKGVKALADYLFADGGAAEQVSVTKDENDVPVVSVTPTAKDVKEAKLDSPVAKAMTKAREINITAKISPTVKADAIEQYASAKGNVALAKAMSKLYVIGGDVTLEQIKNVADTGNPKISLGEWNKMGREEQLHSAKMRNYDATTKLAIARAENVGVKEANKTVKEQRIAAEKAKKEKKAYFKAASDMIASAAKRMSAIKVPNKEFQEARAGEITNAFMSVYNNIGMDPDALYSFMGVDSVNKAMEMYNYQLDNAGKYGKPSAEGAYAAILRGYDSSSNELAMFDESFNQLSTVDGMTPLKSLKLLSDSLVVRSLPPESFKQFVGLANTKPELISAFYAIDGADAEELRQNRKDFMYAVMEQSRIPF